MYVHAVRETAYLKRDQALPRQTGLFLLSTVTMVSCVVLGGGTHAGFLGDVIIQATALPLGLLVIWSLLGRPWKQAGNGPFWAAVFTVLLLAFPLLQLIPVSAHLPWLPSAHLSPGDSAALTSRLQGWQPLSVYPEATWLAWLSLMPPVVLFWGIALLDLKDRRLVSLAVLALGAASAFLGLLQIAQGPSSELRFFEITNQSEAVGFFANRNHFSALLYCEILIVAAWIMAITGEMLEAPRGQRFQSAEILVVAAGFAFLVALIAAQGMARSRAGIFLTGAALAGAIAMTFGTRRREEREQSQRRLIGAAFVIAITLVAEFSLYRAFERFAYDNLQDDSRIVFARNTIEAAKSFMPFGSGLGTFVRVYGLFEKPADTMVNKYANHAHNDWLELWLEMGVAGLVLTALFVLWLAWRAPKIWGGQNPGIPELDVLLAKSASLIIVLLLLHSAVDYPLRTSAIMAVMAFACALLIDPPAPADNSLAAKPMLLRSERSRPGKSRRMQPNLEGDKSGAEAGGGPNAVPGKDELRRPVSGYDTQRWNHPAEWPSAWSPGPSEAKPAPGAQPPTDPVWPADIPPPRAPGPDKKQD